MFLRFQSLLLSDSRYLVAMRRFATIPVPGGNKQLTVPTGLFINNEFVPSVNSNESIQQVE
jgi:hypothetical protein